MGREAEKGKVHYGIARVDLHLPGVSSLKEKRALLRRVESALVAQGCAFTEVGAQDRWQRAVVGVAIAASTPAGVDRVLDALVGIVERDPRVAVLDVVDIVDVLDEGR